LLQGKLKVFATAKNLDLLDTFVLLGDSAMSINRGASLTLQKEASLSTVTAGSAFTYTITVKNNGPASATDVIVRDAIPSALTFTASTPAPTSQNPHTWNLGALAAGASRIITIQVTAKTSAVGLVTNTATASTTAVDLVTGDSSASALVNVIGQADIRLVMKGPTSRVGLQTSIDYELTVTNLGPGLASNLVLTDILPADLSLVYATHAPVVSANTLVWQLGQMQPGMSTTILVRALVKSTAGSQFTNNASASSTSLDPNLSNNEAAVLTGAIPATAMLFTDFSEKGVNGQVVELGWTMAAETGVQKYTLYRAGANNFTVAIKVGEILSTQAGAYTYLDSVPGIGPYFYWLTAVLTGGEESWPLGQVLVLVGMDHKIYLPITNR
jgi:uncharacterized repeat protein (TIGR01451 family)